jgi:hypothetical protein
MTKVKDAAGCYCRKHCSPLLSMHLNALLPLPQKKERRTKMPVKTQALEKTRFLK